MYKSNNKRGYCMSTKQKEYFTVKQLKQVAKDCNYLLLLGERGNGKSYAVKSDVLTQAYKSIVEGKCYKQIGYIRRFDMDSKDSKTEPYWADMPVQEITNNEYSCISVFRKKIYFANIDDNGKPVRGVCIGQCFALASAEHYKSLMYPHITNLIYEEVVSENNQYLTNLEPQRLQQLVSTILRDRVGLVYLIGNTLSRMCPYYTEFGLVGVEDIKLGETKIYKIDDTVIKVHRCKSAKYNSGMFFGRAKKNITEGEYLTNSQPHLDADRKEYNLLHTIILEYNQFKYLMEFLYYPKGAYYIWYVTPKTTPIKPNTRVISNKYNPSPYYTNDFKGINEMERRALYYIELKKVAFSDNLTGTEFYNILDTFN